MQTSKVKGNGRAFAKHIQWFGEQFLLLFLWSKLLSLASSWFSFSFLCFFHLRVMHTIKSPTHYYRSSPIWQLFRFMDIVAVLASNLLFRVVAMPWLSLSRPRIWHWGERVNFWSACWYTVFILARGCCYHCYFAVDTEVAVVAQ